MTSNGWTCGGWKTASSSQVALAAQALYSDATEALLSVQGRRCVPDSRQPRECDLFAPIGIALRKTLHVGTLTVLFRRDPTRDRHAAISTLRATSMLWEDGRPILLGLNAFCYHGQRLLGLGQHLAGRRDACSS